ncbi:hypothetical protein FHR24_001513 [Wenyingzhuangia heitensis]|uniref:Uncharacterized protein n=1 Tax=Wenyingzhuangia heitensis TaxID=1487859 RepID=A0ABX0U8A6_9FLAO|nr:DUF2400 domain-containing protein [Wenyingzhuangia heitensis]NIJ45074.1 hypothetical protein [Wenyingzhuangia heitensis]
MKTYLEKIISEKANWLLNIYPNVESIPFDQLGFLMEHEPYINPKGVKEYKRRTFKNKEVVTIFYQKHYATYKEVENVFIGTSKKLIYYAEDGTPVKQKPTDFYKHDVEPVHNDVHEVVNYVSRASEEFLKNERSNAESKMKASNPIMYAKFYTAYKSLIEDWKATGDATALISAIDNETDPDLLDDVLNKIVEGTVDTTVGNYIKYVIS